MVDLPSAKEQWKEVALLAATFVEKVPEIDRADLPIQGRIGNIKTALIAVNVIPLLYGISRCSRVPRPLDPP